ncbi:MAG: hypothetical protein JWN86_658 [Planctomycetota bacterium]|nr:hypothetical protein [Planctomycetota bacterium]
MTSAAPIKFRCFQCNKLLGVSRSKVGAVVACPQCGTELIVPEPLDEAPAPEPKKPDPPVPTPVAPSPRTSLSGSRIEPAVVLWDNPPEPGSTEQPAFPTIQTEPLSLRPDPPVPFKGASRSRSETQEIPRPEPSKPATPSPEPRPTASAPPRIVPEAVPMPLVNLDLTAIRERDADEPRSASPIGPLRETSARRNDVVLPRAAVMLWSFLVLLGVVSAFAAGLLAGRFLWAPGVPLSMPTGPVAAPARR